MNLLLVGDLHLKYTAPKNRCDNWEKTRKEKLEFIFKCASENMALVLKAGDIFDSPREPYQIINEYLELLNVYQNVNVVTVFGQHDLRYHTDMFNTPLQTLEIASNQIYCAGKVPYNFYERVHVYGANWNEEIPEIVTQGFNVLILHKMIVNDQTLWEGQEDYTYANHLLHNCKYDLIVSGDNHQFFMCHKDGVRYLFNMGSVFRTTIAQLNHIPQVCLFDTDTLKYQLIPIPIRPVNEVFRIEKVSTEKEKNLQLESFMETLQKMENGDNTDIQIEQVFLEYMSKNNIDKETQDLVFESLGGIDAKRTN